MARIGLVLLISAAFALSVSSNARAGWWDDLDKGESVRLSDVFAQPRRFAERILTFPCVLMGRDEVFFPLHTPFTEQRFENFAVWEDGTPVWDERAYKEKIRPYLYIDKRHVQRDALLRTPTLTRLEVTARIRTIHRDVPFLEVLSFRPTGHRLGDFVVRNVIDGDNKVRDGELDIALDAYQRALTPDIPPIYALQIRKRAGDLLRRLGRPQEADAMEGGDIRGAAPAPLPPVGPAEPLARPPIFGPGDAPPTSDLPAEGPPTGDPASAPVPTRGQVPERVDVPGATPFITRDLPGVAVDAAPPAPAATVPPGAIPPGAKAPVKRPARKPPAPAPGTPAAPGTASSPSPAPPADPPPAQPPERAPRLEGVK